MFVSVKIIRFLGLLLISIKLKKSGTTNTQTILSMTNAPGFPQIREILRKCNLMEYYERLIAEGFDDLQSLLEVTETDLIAMDVKRGHRRRLQREISTLKGVPASLPLYIPPGPALEDQTNTNSILPQVTSDHVHMNNILQNNAKMLYANVAPVNLNRGSPMLPRDHASKEDDPRDNRDPQNNENTKRKYKRHPKRDKNAPVKPLSAYVMFAHRVREEYQGQNIPFPDMAKIVGDRWKTIPTAEKEAIESEAAKAKGKYRAELEVYKTTEQWKQYQEYLKDFKAKYETSFRGDLKQRKRSKIEPSPEPENNSHSGYSSARSTSLGYQSSGSSNSNGCNGGDHNMHLHNHQGVSVNNGPHIPHSYSGSNYNVPNFHQNCYLLNYPNMFDYNPNQSNGGIENLNISKNPHHHNQPHNFGSRPTNNMTSNGTSLADLYAKDDEQSPSMSQNGGGGGGGRRPFDDSGVSTDNFSATSSNNNTPPPASVESEETNNVLNNSGSNGGQSKQSTEPSRAGSISVDRAMVPQPVH
ncbi:hypothetical protein G9A89_019218 [Geosiphon pyriformis]|nr:hypothetical protein G9A89_019218 [Geosiphon pyriformis]